MTWQNDDYVTDVSDALCPLCRKKGCMLKVRFEGQPARSLDRPIVAMYTNCSVGCRGGLNINIKAMSQERAIAFLRKIGNPLARAMAHRIKQREIHTTT